MKNTSRGLSLAAVIVAAVNVIAAIGHFLVAQSSQWLAIGTLIFAVSTFPLALVLRCSFRKAHRFRWTGLLCMIALAGALFVSDTVAEVLLKIGTSPTVPNLEWVDMVMVYSILTAFAAGALTFTAAFLDAMNTLRHLRDGKEPLNLSVKVFWTDIVVGTLCLVAFLASFANNRNVVKLIIIGIYLVSLIVSQMRSDRFDEMALENYRHAKAKTMDILLIILMGGFATALLAETLFPDLKCIPALISGQASDYLMRIILVFYGLQSLIKGLIFRKLEAS